MSNLKDKVINQIKKVYDPEIPVNIYELGLIYKIEVDDKNKVNVDILRRRIFEKKNKIQNRIIFVSALVSVGVISYFAG